MKPLATLPTGLLALLLVAGPAVGQVPAPAESNPLPTTTAPDPTGPAATPAQPVPVPRPVQSGAAAPGLVAPAPTRQTLVPTPGEPNDVDEVTLPAKPAVILSGATKWEEAVPALKEAFAKLEAELVRSGIRPTGRPLSIFTKTEDDGFQFEAMIPIGAVPQARPEEAGGLRFGTTPSGRALRFPHKGSYDEIDGTYETLTAYLDAKNIAVQDRFIEEYVSDLNDGADEKLDVNIYALPKPEGAP